MNLDNYKLPRPVMPAPLILDNTEELSPLFKLGSQPKRLSREETQVLEKEKHYLLDTSALVPERTP